MAASGDPPEPVDLTENGDDSDGETPDSKKARGPGGAPISSLVWNYGRYDPKTNKTTCIVTLDDQTTCGTKLTGKYASTLLKHLRLHTFLKIDELMRKKKAEDEERKRKGNGLYTQLSLSESFAIKTANANVQNYPKSHPKQQKVDKLIAVYIGSTSTPKSHVERKEFREILEALDPKYKPPTRQDISNTIAEVEHGIRKKIMDILAETSCISAICIDLWSRKNLTASYVGVTGHFFDSKKGICRVLLGLERLDYPHTAERIVDATNGVLSKWNLDLSSDKIFRILTDNGTNVVKAFREFVQEICFTVTINAEAEDGDYNVEAEEDDTFERREQQLDICIDRKKRLSCIDHQLARILMVATEGKKTAQCEGCDLTAKEIIDVVHELLSNLRTRGKAAEYFMERYNKKLLQPPKTRWAYHYYVVKRLLELKDGIRQLIDEEIVDGVQNLTPLQWRMVKALHDILEPFSVAVTDLEGEFYVTLSHVIPFLMNINISLIHHTETSCLSGFAEKLQRFMDTRFKFIFDPTDTSFEPIYAVATLLDPKLFRTYELAELRRLKREAVDVVERQLRHYYKKAAEENDDTLIGSETVTDGTANYSFLSSRINVAVATQNNRGDANSAAKAEVDYFLKIVADNLNVEAMDFWKMQRENMPNLYKYAMSVLSVPATTAPVERLFSQARNCLGINRYRIDDTNLERELMIRVNNCLLGD